MLTTQQGISILKGGDSVEGQIKALLSLFNVESIEQLTEGEIRQVNKMLEEFQEAVTGSVDVSKMSFSFRLKYEGKDYEVFISDISEILLDLDVVMNFEVVQAEHAERVPYLVACVFAKHVRSALGLKCRIFDVIALLNKECWSMPFAQIYPLYTFFLGYKKMRTENSVKCIAEYVRIYRENLRGLQSKICIIESLGASSKTKELRRSSRGWIRLRSYLVILKTVTFLCVLLAISRCTKLFRKQHRTM